MSDQPLKKFEVFSHPLPRRIGGWNEPVIYSITVEGRSIEEVADRMRKDGFVCNQHVLIPWPPVAIIVL